MCAENGGKAKAGGVDVSSRDPFEYLATCHIGHHVEVHLIDGSVYSGVFHAADVENNFGERTKPFCSFEIMGYIYIARSHCFYLVHLQTCF